ncbi:hypothetical protein D9M70_541980 [compost metagenome]
MASPISGLTPKLWWARRQARPRPARPMTDPNRLTGRFLIEALPTGLDWACSSGGTNAVFMAGSVGLDLSLEIVSAMIDLSEIVE